MATHPGQLSLLELARLERPGADDAALVGHIAAETVERLAETPPIELEVVAAFRDINDIRREELDVSGSLTPEESGLVMRLRRSDSKVRQRFTGFHEVAHTFQPGYWDSRQLRCQTSAVPTGRRPHKEALSDLGAVELLMPRRFVEADLAEADFGIATIEAIAGRYEASIHASAFRMSEVWPEPTIVIALEQGLRKEEAGREDAEPRLRVVHSFSNGSWPHVPKNKSAANGGPLVEAFEGPETVEAETDLSDLVRGGAGEAVVSAKGFEYRAGDGAIRRRVLAIARRPIEKGMRHNREE